MTERLSLPIGRDIAHLLDCEWVAVGEFCPRTGRPVAFIAEGKRASAAYAVEWDGGAPPWVLPRWTLRIPGRGTFSNSAQLTVRLWLRLIATCALAQVREIENRGTLQAHFGLPHAFSPALLDADNPPPEGTALTAPRRTPR